MKDKADTVGYMYVLLITFMFLALPVCDILESLIRAALWSFLRLLFWFVGLAVLGCI
jgi:hypothetical protein